MDDKAKLRESFEKAAAKNAPKPPYFKHGFAAFTVGGGICVFAQFLINTFQSFGMTYSEASATEPVQQELKAFLYLGHNQDKWQPQLTP